MVRGQLLNVGESMVLVFPPLIQNSEFHSLICSPRWHTHDTPCWGEFGDFQVVSTCPHLLESFQIDFIMISKFCK